MATPAQLTAAVANAQHSTGPRTPEGKAASSRNAVKFGIYSHADILPGEDPAELAALVSEIEERFRPCTNVENTLCHEAIHGMWLYHRFLRIEHEIVQIRVAALAPEQSKYALGHVYAQDLAADKVLEKIDRRRRAALRQPHAAIDQLVAIEIHRSRQSPPPKPVNPIPANPVRFDAPQDPDRAARTPAPSNDPQPPIQRPAPATS